MNKQRKCLYTPYKVVDGEILLELDEFRHEGYFEYWGQTSRVNYSSKGDPIVEYIVVAIVHSAKTGQVHMVPPHYLKFKT